VPRWVTDLESFRRWTHAEDFPDYGLIASFDGKLWIEAQMETVLHNKAKGKVCAVVETIVEEEELGHLVVDRMRLSHPEAGLSTEADATFASLETLQRQRLQVKQGPVSSELVGSSDMVLEVVSTSSVQKDTVVLPQLYWKAGIREYWRIDPRGTKLRFDIFLHAKEGYEPVKARNGWLKSAVFGKSFRLTMKLNGLDLPVFKLEVR